MRPPGASPQDPAQPGPKARRAGLEEQGAPPPPTGCGAQGGAERAGLAPPRPAPPPAAEEAGRPACPLSAHDAQAADDPASLAEGTARAPGAERAPAAESGTRTLGAQPLAAIGDPGAGSAAVSENRPSPDISPGGASPPAPPLAAIGGPGAGSTAVPESRLSPGLSPADASPAAPPLAAIGGPGAESATVPESRLSPGLSPADASPAAPPLADARLGEALGAKEGASQPRGAASATEEITEANAVTGGAPPARAAPGAGAADAATASEDPAAPGVASEASAAEEGCAGRETWVGRDGVRQAHAAPAAVPAAEGPTEAPAQRCGCGGALPPDPGAAPDRSGLRGLPVWALIALLSAPIIVYRYAISPMLGRNCRFEPSCSAYGLEALRVHGPVMGLWLTLRRIARCHPWGGMGHDPVPPRRPPGDGRPG